MRIDLHCHSSASDGTQPPVDVITRARLAGVDVLALTDHDTVAGIAEATAALPAGLTLVPGTEISCIDRGGTAGSAGQGISLHLLGYLFDPAEPTLAAALHDLRTDRERRAREMVTRLQELGALVTWEQVSTIAGEAPVGRPHVARALADVGVVAEPADAFTPEWIADGGRAYVDKHALDPRDAIALVHGAGGVVVFAHPGASGRGRTVDDTAIREMAAAGLDGLEIDHPDHDADARAHLRALAVDLDLLVTGGSDDHGVLTGHRLGCESTAVAAYDALVARAAGAGPVVAA